MAQYALFCVFFFLLSSCSENKHNDNEESTIEDEEISRDLCFLQVTIGEPRIVDQDTIPGATDSLSIQLHIEQDSVTGILDWLPEEKDKMKGSLKGKIAGNIIEAIYTYEAEGTTAKEEKIFKIQDNHIQMKVGELEEKQGVWVLKNKDSAAFGRPIPTVNCP